MFQAVLRALEGLEEVTVTEQMTRMDAAIVRAAAVADTAFKFLWKKPRQRVAKVLGASSCIANQ